MFSYCRLCAELKEPTELQKTVFDWNIKEKLIACCMWKPSNEEYQIPQAVCNGCVDELDNCWKFAMRITESEQKLLQIAHFTANELELKDETEPGHEFIEVKDELPVEQLEAEEASTSVSETESDQSKDNKRIVRKTNKVKKKRPATKSNNIRNVLLKSECNADGTITDEGIAKMQHYLTEIETKTWNDCKFKCNDCDYSTRGFKKFHTHDQTTHSQFLMKRSYPCLFCDQVCKRLQSLVVHISYRHLPHLTYWLIE